MNVFFSADSHWGHANIIRFCNRPFKNVHEMNDVMIQRWNEVVPVDGLTYFLGDFAFGAHGWIKQIREQLNGEILFVRGSHDKGVMKAYGNIPYIREIKIDKQLIVLCHYRMAIWPKSHYNSIQLYAHSHGNSKPIGKQMDVGVDTNNFYPYSLGNIMRIMEEKPDNVNFVGKTQQVRLPKVSNNKDSFYEKVRVIDSVLKNDEK